MLYSWGEFGHVPELCIFSGIGFVTCCGQFGSGQTPIKLIYFEENVFIECHRSVALMRLYVSVFNQNKLSEDGPSNSHAVLSLSPCNANFVTQQGMLDCMTCVINIHDHRLPQRQQSTNLLATYRHTILFRNIQLKWKSN
jgi:hypothetical protein